MLTREHFTTFDDRKELLSFCVEWMRRRTGPIAVVAGHFMLGYEESQSRLVPLIRESNNLRELHAMAHHVAGGFPMRTFRIGLDLLDACAGSAKIAFLVNDHFFLQSIPKYMRTEEAMSGLRRKFYRSEESVPAPYLQELNDRGLNPNDVLLVHHRSQARSQDLLPKESFFFSEQSLRSRFDNTTRKRLSDLPGFWEEHRLPEGPPSLFYGPNVGKYARLCLTSEGVCGCMGEIVELAYTFDRLGVRNSIMFIPDECHDSVNSAALAAVDGAAAADAILVVTGLGGKGEISANSWRPIIWEYVR